MRYTIVLLVAASILGCTFASHPVATESTRLVGSDRMLSEAWAAPSNKTGLVVVKRDSGGFEAMSNCTDRLYVDGQPVADMLIGERVELHIDEGKHILSFTAQGRCDWGDLIETSVFVVAGEKLIYRIGMNMDGDRFIQATAF